MNGALLAPAWMLLALASSCVADSSRSAHAWRLTSAMRERSLSRIAPPHFLAPFIHRLQQGLPVTVGQLGASVGQDGGCIAQPYRRYATTSSEAIAGLASLR